MAKKKVIEVRVYQAEFLTTNAEEHNIEIIAEDVNKAIKTVERYIDEYLDDQDLIDLQKVERVGAVFVDHTQWKDDDDDDD